MAIARVQGTDIAYASAVTARTLAFTSNLTAGNLLVVFVATYNANITVTVTDSLGHTYTQLRGLYAQNLDARISLWYVENCSAGACTITVTPSAAAYVSIAINEYSGAGLLRSWKFFGGTSTTAADLIVPGWINTQNGDLVVGAYVQGLRALTTCTVNSPYTIRANIINGSSFSALNSCDNINGSPNDDDIVFTRTGGTDFTWTFIGASFRAIGGEPDDDQLLCQVGEIDTRTTTGQQTYSTNFKPKVLFFSSEVLAVDLPANTAFLSFGCAVGPLNEAGICTISDDAATAQTTQRRHSNSCLVACNSAGTLFMEANLVGITSNSFTLNYTTATAVSRKVRFMALGGGALRNAGIQTILSPTSIGNQVLSGYSFQPDIIIPFGIFITTAPPSTTAFEMFGIGAASATEQIASSFGGGSSNDPSISYRTLVTDKCIRIISSVALGDLVAASRQSLDANGFTLNWSTVSTARYFFVLSLEGSFKHKIGTETQKTSPGLKETPLDFLTKGLLIGSVCNITSTANEDQARFSLGASDGINNAVGWIGDKNFESILTKTSRYRSIASCVAMATEDSTIPTIQAEAKVEYFASDKFVLNWSKADNIPREFFYLALGEDKPNFVDGLTLTESVNYTRIQTDPPDPLEGRVLIINQPAPTMDTTGIVKYDDIITTTDATYINSVGVYPVDIYSTAAPADHSKLTVLEGRDFSGSSALVRYTDVITTTDATAFDSGTISPDVFALLSILPGETFIRHAEDALIFTEIAAASFSVSQGVDEFLELGEILNFNHTFVLSVNEAITFAEETYGRAPLVINQANSDTLTFNETTIKRTAFKRNFSEGLALNEIVYGARAIARDAVDSLTFNENLVLGRAYIRHTADSLPLTENLVNQSTFTRNIDEFLELKGGMLKYVGSSVFSIAEAEYVLKLRKCRVILQSATRAVILPCPKLGDLEANLNQQIVKRSMNNSLYTYVRKNELQKLSYAFEIGSLKRIELEEFFEENVGKVITLLNWKGELWKVNLINNPLEMTGISLYANEGEKYEVTLEFHGIRVI